MVWFRQDLRLKDNPALQAAIERGEPVVPVFIYDEKGEGQWSFGGASKWWLHHALKDLAEQLADYDLRLVIRQGKSGDVLKQLLQDTGAEAVFWNRRYEPEVIKRDKQIKEALTQDDFEVKSFNAALVHEPWEIKNQSGKPFQVFTPYWKHCLKLDTPPPVSVDIRQAKVPKQWPNSLELEALQLLPKIKWDTGFYDYWTPTAAAAHQRLGKLAASGASGYTQGRDFPAEDATSRLSPYLHFGQIGPREVFAAFDRHDSDGTKGGRKFLSEIGWREFSHHLLYHWPHLPTDPLREEFNHFPWEMDEKLLRAWQKGETGYPIIDAGMRQLWATGWMHNRVRMIVASLLVKHLLIPWQEGARWFWDTLVDADLANNTQGWQWSAGCGADAAPYFRVFNPILQGQKFDLNGDYVREWVPELRPVADGKIHEPWEAGLDQLGGVVIGRDYPAPIVDHKRGRNRALQAYEKLKALRSK
ncbi:cryptochrome/photolyase family protein [Cerasicoccus frondis]|uniref:cryptochrome/photolyase family protein n=1 Tax=Cerasicoccus frondis TaxID=490090 RepID=UPI002852CA8B|nr:deoxyribodipyrimidine photo-lyase [Cerasicoccus frondis]